MLDKFDISFSEDINGSSFFNSKVFASKHQLTEIFGEPHFLSDTNDKVQCEWYLQYKGSNAIHFTIYDWKEYRKFTDVEEIEWHIGGFRKDETDLVSKIIQLAVLNIK